MHDSDPDDDFNISLDSFQDADAEADQDTATMPAVRGKADAGTSRSQKGSAAPRSSAHPKKDAAASKKQSQGPGKRKKQEAAAEEPAVASEKRTSRHAKVEQPSPIEEAVPSAAGKKKKEIGKKEEKTDPKEEERRGKKGNGKKKDEKKRKQVEEKEEATVTHAKVEKVGQKSKKQAAKEAPSGIARRSSRSQSELQPSEEAPAEERGGKSKGKGAKPAAKAIAAPSSKQKPQQEPKPPAAELISARDQKAVKRKNRELAILEEANQAGPSGAGEGSNTRHRGKRSRPAPAAALPAPAPAPAPQAAAAAEDRTPLRHPEASPGGAAVVISPRHPPQTSSPLNRRESRRQPSQPAVASTPVTARRQIVSVHESSDDEELERNAVDEAQHAEQDVAAVAREWLMNAVMNPRSREAAAAPIRKSLQSAVQFIVGNVEWSITNSENNSVLILGERGGGKTLAIERALDQISSQWNTDPEDPLVGIVRLYGWAHHEERVAFKEIARQLCDTFKLKFLQAASNYENLNFYREVLDGLARGDKVAVFVLDEFDLFAGSKQTLLYNLLDALLVSGVRAVVLGTSVRHDVVEMLEKRVKSRFSHRKLDVQPPASAQGLGEEGEEGGPSAAAAATPGMGSPGGQALVGALGITAEASKEGTLEVLQQMLSLPMSFPNKTHAKAHNKAVKKALKDPSVKKAIEEFTFVSNSLHELRNVVRATLLASSSAPQGLIQPKAIVDACKKLDKGILHGMEEFISGLSVLELIMLVSAYRAAKRNEGEAINFEMAYAEFSIYATSGEHVDSYSKSAASKAFYKLAEMGLVAPHGAQAGSRVGSNSQFAPMDVLISLEELQAGIVGHATCPTRLRDWVGREGGPATAAAVLL